MPDKDTDKIPIAVEVPKADVWLRADYRDIVHRLGEVHMIRACEHQHDDDFVPMYDYQTLEQHMQKAESLRSELDRAWAEVDKLAKQLGDLTTIRKQDELVHGNIMGRIAVNLFGKQNNVTDEDCVAETAAIGYRITGLYQRLAQMQEERNAANVELKVWQDRSRIQTDEETYDLERSVVGSVVAGFTADRCGQCGACDRTVVLVDVGNREDDNMVMMPPLPRPNMMIVGEWFSRDDLLAYGRAVAEACAVVCDARDFGDNGPSSMAARRSAVAIREMAKGGT